MYSQTFLGKRSHVVALTTPLQRPWEETVQPRGPGFAPYVQWEFCEAVIRPEQRCCWRTGKGTLYPSYVCVCPECPLSSSSATEDKGLVSEYRVNWVKISSTRKAGDETRFRERERRLRGAAIGAGP